MLRCSVIVCVAIAGRAGPADFARQGERPGRVPRSTTAEATDGALKAGKRAAPPNGGGPPAEKALRQALKQG